jgi:dsDNA-binding SOS-regulon protein
MSELKQAYVVDGQVFASKAEAMDYIRIPKIKAALMALTDNNADLSDWLINNQEVVTSAFETGTIRRITKSDSNKIEKAFDAMAASEDSVYKFLVDNRESLEIKYKTQSRLTDEEKVAQAKQTIADASDGNEELADWVIENKDSVIEAYSAGKQKREVSPNAKKALEDYRKKQAAIKAASAA